MVARRHPLHARQRLAPVRRAESQGPAPSQPPSLNPHNPQPVYVYVYATSMSRTPYTRTVRTPLRRTDARIRYTRTHGCACVSTLATVSPLLEREQ